MNTRTIAWVTGPNEWPSDSVVDRVLLERRLDHSKGPYLAAHARRHPADKRVLVPACGDRMVTSLCGLTRSGRR